MKKILILTLLISFIGIDIQAQSWQQVFGRQRFNAGIGIPVRDTLSPNAADSAQIVIRPQDGILYYRYKGWWIRASAQDTSNFVTVAGAAQTITSEKTFRTPLNVIAGASGGATMTFNSTANGGNKWHIGAWSNVNDLPRSFGFYNELSGKTPLVIDTQRLQFINPFQITWTVEDLGYADSGYPNAGMAWDSLNRLQINNGTAGSYADLKLRSLISTDLSGTGTRIVYADNNGKLSASGTLTGYLLKADSLSGGYTSWLLTKKKVDSLGAIIATKGSGTVTSVAAGTGMNFSTITSTGTINADTTVLSTKANVTGLLTGYATTGSLSGYVTLSTAQNITGAKTFSSDITVNSMRVGLGGGSQTQNVALGLTSLNSNTTGTFNTSIGFQSLFDNTTAVNNTAVGSQSLTNLTTGSNNIGIGVNAGSISAGAADLTTNTNSIFLGSNTKASANGNTNEIVIGDNTTGNGSNTVTIGNSSITNTYLKGVINGTSLSMSGAITGASLNTSTSSNVVGSINTTNATGGYMTWATNGTTIADLGTATQIFGSGGSEVFGINGRGARAIAFGTNNTQRVTITSSGNVGIATTAPAAPLTVQASNNLNDNAILLYNNSTAAGAYVAIGSYFANGNTNVNSQIRFGNEAASAALSYLAFTTGTSTSSTEKMRITSGGNVGVGTTSPVQKLHVVGTGVTRMLVENTDNQATGAGIQMLVKSSGTTVSDGTVRIDNAGRFSVFNGTTSAAENFYIVAGGAATFASSVTATGFFESSDLRLKNIVKRDGDVVYFNWKNGQDKNLHIGYIAQEVQKTNPDQVKADEKGFLSVNYTEVLVQKVRELEKQIAELQKRIK